MDACSSIDPSATLHGRLEHLARDYICSPSLPECHDSHELAHSGGVGSHRLQQAQSDALGSSLDRQLVAAEGQLGLDVLYD
jgi:hypothetical protein